MKRQNLKAKSVTRVWSSFVRVRESTIGDHKVEAIMYMRVPMAVNRCEN